MQIEEFFSQYHLPIANKTLVVAVSGGPDSMALLDMLYMLKRQIQFTLIAAHLDHQLRSDSQREQAVLQGYCQHKQITLITANWPVALHPVTGIEAAARDYRYQFLLETARQKGGDYLLTAHHVDDLIENILLKFIRSGNPSEMNSLQPVSHLKEVTLLRPLLSVAKKDLLAYVQAAQLDFVIDQTNQQDDVLRNRLRHHVVPLLKQENPQLAQNALRFSRQISQMTALNQHQFEQVRQPELFLGFAYRLAQVELGFLTSSEQIYFWQNFIWQTWHLRVNEHLPGFKLLAYQGYFYLMKEKFPQLSSPQSVTVGQKFIFNARSLIITSQRLAQKTLVGSFCAPSAVHFSAASLQPGEKLLLKNGQHVKNKKMFAQSAIPKLLRPYCLALHDAQRVLFVEQTYCNQQIDGHVQKYFVYNVN